MYVGLTFDYEREATLDVDVMREIPNKMGERGPNPVNMSIGPIKGAFPT